MSLEKTSEYVLETDKAFYFVEEFTEHGNAYRYAKLLAFKHGQSGEISIPYSNETVNEKDVNVGRLIFHW